MGHCLKGYNMERIKSKPPNNPTEEDTPAKAGVLYQLFRLLIRKTIKL